MTKHDLKEMRNLGAELGAAKAEVERLRGLLEAALYYVPSNKTELRALIDAALEHSCKNCEGVQPESCMFAKQAEPTDTFTAVDMATAAAQGFRDGQAAAEQGPAQDEREAYSKWRISMEPYGFNGVDAFSAGATWQRTRPAQTEQQPVCWASSAALAKLRNGRNNSPCVLTDGPAEFNDTPLYAIAQTAPQPEQSGLPSASAKWAKYDTSWVVDYLRDETNFDADAVGEMLEFARRAALSTQGAGDASA